MKIQLLVKETSLTKAPADGILVLAQPFQHSIRLSGKQSAVFRWWEDVIYKKAVTKKKI